MRYKLVDAINKGEEGVYINPSKLCMQIGTHSYEMFILEDENGKQYEFESGYWGYDGYMSYTYGRIRKIVKFADWLEKQNLPEVFEPKWFWEVVDNYIHCVQ